MIPSSPVPSSSSSIPNPNQLVWRKNKMELEKKPKRGVHDGDGESWPQLMEDLLFEEVLPRLPVKYLIRLKLVSKKWLHHITNDSHFIHNHLCHQSQTTKLSIILSRSQSLAMDRLFIIDHNSNKARVIDTSVYTKRSSGDFPFHHVIGSCNGMVCIGLSSFFSPSLLVSHQNHREAVVLWNPETGAVRDIAVPSLPRSFYQEHKPYHPVYGFGFDKYHDDYKVVRVLPTGLRVLNFDVFSRNGGCWRRLENELIGYTVYRESCEPVLVNNCLFWLVAEVDEGISTVRRRCILSFDLCDEEFRIVHVIKDYVTNLNRNFVPYPSRLIKYEGDCMVYFSVPEGQTGNRRDFRVELIVDNNGNVVNDGTSMTVPGFSLSKEKPSFRVPNLWKFCGVSHGKLFVAEKDLKNKPFDPAKLMIYDPLNPIGTREDMLSVFCFKFSIVHDYVSSLVSVYPSREMIVEGNKKMEARYLVDMFWKTLALEKQQFGIDTSIVD